MSTTAQYMAALERANKVRLARSAVKHQLRDGSMSVEEALGHPAVHTMEIAVLLEAQRDWGPARVWDVFQRLRRLAPPVIVSEFRSVGKLTARERAAIVRACKENAR